MCVVSSLGFSTIIEVHLCVPFQEKANVLPVFEGKEMCWMYVNLHIVYNQEMKLGSKPLSLKIMWYKDAALSKLCLLMRQSNSRIRLHCLSRVL